jgi:hypothetical protein
MLCLYDLRWPQPRKVCGDRGSGVMLLGVKPLQDMIRDTAAPMLKARGFKRSHGTFRKITDDGVAVIAIRSVMPIHSHDIECNVDTAFMTHAWLASDENRVGMTAERSDIFGLTSHFQAKVRDPGLTVKDMSNHWRFDRSDQRMLELFTTVLEMAADDLLHRLAIWPTVPTDSLSDPPVFRTPVEWETRSKWSTQDDGELDLRYADWSEVHTLHGTVGDATFTFDVIHADPAHADPRATLWDLMHTNNGPIIGLGPDALDVVTGKQSVTDWARRVHLQPQPYGVRAALTPTPPLIRVQDASTKNATLSIAAADGYPEVRFDLGEMPPAWIPQHENRYTQVAFVTADNDSLRTLTWRTSCALAAEGRLWGASVPIEPFHRWW